MITNIDILKQDLPYIYNIKNFLVTPEKFHPDNPKYIAQWNRYKKHCIEGLWAYDQYGYRYMPPTLFYYGNFFKIEDQEGKQRVIKKPSVRDIDWLIHYSYLICCGFSGFEDDDTYSCDVALIDKNILSLVESSMKEEDKKRWLHLHSTNGKLKTYVKPSLYLKDLQTSPKGRTLYFNQCSNLMLFGSRGGGKSYSIAGIISQILSFDGLKEYNKDALAKSPKANISVGAGIADKSSELLDKVVTNHALLGTDPDFGAWGTPGTPDFIPGPFYVDWVGSIKPNNAQNPYRYEYQVETSSGWQTLGSGTKLVHVNYSEKKATGTQSAAGSRNALVVYTEIGLMGNFRDALLSNEATVSADHERFAVQLADGTSGNIDLVQQTKMVFNDPDTYHFLAFDNIWEQTDHKIGLFLPAYLTNGKFKDSNGNTDIEKALMFFEQRRKDAASKDDIEVLRNEKMNYPLVPSDMWTSSRGSYFPVAELLDREKQLLTNNQYKTIGTPVELIWDSTRQSGVRADLLDKEVAEPYYTFPYDKSMSKVDGCCVMYHPPEYMKGEIPKDFYIYTLDPYVSENIDEGGSIGCFQIWLNRKYSSEGYNGNQLVFTYYGKNPSGKDAFYEVIEKAIQLYGNCPRMLWYEANRGDSVRGYFIRKSKTYLLCIRPTREKGSSAKERVVTEYGFMVSNKIDKLNMITDTSEWLLETVTHNGRQIRTYESIPDLFLLNQLVQYTIDGNYDAVSALLGLPLALKEIEHIYNFEAEKKNKKNPLAAISLNPNIFHVRNTKTT